MTDEQIEASTRTKFSGGYLGWARAILAAAAQGQEPVATCRVGKHDMRVEAEQHAAHKRGGLVLSSLVAPAIAAIRKHLGERG